MLQGITIFVLFIICLLLIIAVNVLFNDLQREIKNHKKTYDELEKENYNISCELQIKKEKVAQLEKEYESLRAKYIEATSIVSEDAPAEKPKTETKPKRTRKTTTKKSTKGE